MFRRIALRLACTRANVEKYLDHLRNSDEELPLLVDLLPNHSSSMNDVRQFHSLLIDVLEENNDKFVGVKVTAPSSDTMKALRATEAVCSPLFASSLGRTTFSARKQRIQFVEAALCVPITSSAMPLPAELQASMSAAATATRAASASRTGSVTALPSAASIVAGNPGASLLRKTAELCPHFQCAIEVTGSRFPFYAPSVQGFASDLAGCVGLVIGGGGEAQGLVHGRRWQEVAAVTGVGGLSNHSFVLTRDDEPVQVGAARVAHILSAHGQAGVPDKLGSRSMAGAAPNDAVFTAVAYAVSYAASIGRPLRAGDIVVLSGMCQRVPATSGTYRMNYGPHGSVRCNIED